MTRSWRRQVRAAPPVVWAYAAMALVTPFYVNLALAGRTLDSPQGWAGVGLAVLLAVGLLGRWRWTWAAAVIIDLLLLVGGLVSLRLEPVAGTVVAVRAGVGLGILLLPATGRHVFGTSPHGDSFDAGSSTIRDPDEQGPPPAPAARGDTRR